MVVCHGDGFLHYLGNKKDVTSKKFLPFEISDMNEQNKYGECLLFVAAYFSEYDIVSNLLHVGADANIQNNAGNTPLHAAAYYGNVKMMQYLVNGGADMRIVNKDGLKPSQVVKHAKNHVKVKAFERNLFSNLQNHLKPNYVPIHVTQKKMNIVDSLVKFKSSSIQTVNPHYIYPSGFGNYAWKNQTINGLVSYVETIHNSTDFGKEQIFPNCMYGNFALYNGFWNQEKVTIKMINSMADKGNSVGKKEEIMANFLYKEAHAISSLRHPDILLLMCVNLISNNSSSMIYYQLVFEKINVGSLNSILYEKDEDMVLDVKHLFSQIVNAISYLHSHSLVHCSISSYAIYLLDDTTAKLGNFEYIFEMKIPSYKNKNHCLSAVNINDTIYKWMAPELFNNSQNVSTSTDVYGLTVTMYEVFIKQIPNKNRSLNDTFRDFFKPFDKHLMSNVPMDIQHVLNKGLDFEPSERPKIRNIVAYLNKAISKHEAIYSSIDKSLKSENRKMFEQIRDNPIYRFKVLPNPSVTNLSRKSNSLTCLSPPLSSIGYSSSIHRYANTKPSLTSTYRELAALPPSYPEWVYPHPQTEQYVEGHGTLPSGLVPAFKPASHQVSLSSSHTSVSDLPGQPIDLIKTSSNPQKTSSHASVYSDIDSFLESVPSTVISKQTTSTITKNPFITRRSKNLTSPTQSFKSDAATTSSSSISPGIAHLINHYETNHNHPYSANKSKLPLPISPKPKSPFLKKPPMSPITVKKSPLAVTKTKMTPLAVTKTKMTPSNNDVENRNPLLRDITSPRNLRPVRKGFVSKILGDISNKYM